MYTSLTGRVPFALVPLSCPHGCCNHRNHVLRLQNSCRELQNDQRKHRKKTRHPNAQVAIFLPAASQPHLSVQLLRLFKVRRGTPVHGCTNVHCGVISTQLRHKLTIFGKAFMSSIWIFSVSANLGVRANLQVHDTARPIPLSTMPQNKQCSRHVASWTWMAGKFCCHASTAIPVPHTSA